MSLRRQGASVAETRIVVGFHGVGAALRSDPERVQEVYLDRARRDRRARDLAEAVERAGVRLVLVDGARLEGLAGPVRHQGVVARVAATAAPRDLAEILDGLDEPALLLVLDGITDPHNLGACLRVADAAGAHAVVAPRDRAAGLSATVSRVACGAAESVPYLTVTNLARTLDEIREMGIWIAGADGAAPADLYSATLVSPLAWVLGAEGSGLRRLTRERCDALLRIPMFGAVESLNVSVAAGVCLFEARRQRLAGR